MIARVRAWSFGAVLLAACGSPIVGAECRPGWLECAGVCVEVQSDEHNCGACGHECGPFECSGGMCGPLRAHEDDAGLDAGLDAGMSLPDAGGGDASTTHGIGKGGIGSPFLPDSGLSGCAIGETECDTGCANTLHDRNHCGDCDTQCRADQYCIEGMCEDICSDPLQLCEGACVDYQTDEYNCGSCGHVCASGICMDGVCSDVIPGSLVLIGHDFNASTRSIPPAMKTIAGNSVFLAPGAQIRVLIYRGSARSTEYNAVVNAIDANGGKWTKVDVKADDIVAQLRDGGALVILPQDGTGDRSLFRLGEQWSLALSQFLYRGGVVVLFEGAGSTNTGTFHVLEAAHLFEASGRELIPRQTLAVKTPGIDIGANAPSHYRSAGGTVHFLDVQSDGVVVVEDGAGQPVVIHRVISP